MSRKLTCIILWMSLSVCLLAQTTFQKVIIGQESAYFEQLLASPDGKSVYGLATENVKAGNLFKLDDTGNVAWSKRISSDDSFFYQWYTALDDGVVLPVNTYQNNLIAKSQLLRLDAQGKILWVKKLSNDSMVITRIVQDDDGFFWTIVNKTNSIDLFAAYTFLVKIDKNGNILKAKRLQINNKKAGATQVIFDKLTGLVLININDEVSQLPPNYAYMFAFDKQMNLQWSKRGQPNMTTVRWSKMGESIVYIGFLVGDKGTSSLVGKIKITDGTIESMKVINSLEFPYIATNDNEMMMGHYGNKKISKRDANFNPIWTKKYDNCDEKISIFPVLMPSGECLFSKTIENYPNFIYGKTDTNGQIAACSSSDAAPVTLQDTAFSQMINFANFSLENATLSFTATSISVVKNSLSAKDYCPRPDASFAIPNEICQNATFQPKNVLLPNEKHAWNFSQTSKEFSPIMTYSTLGKKEVTHEVTMDGCTDIKVQKIDILPAPILPRDTQVCNNKPLILNFKNNNATTYFLENQAFTPPLILSTSGIYNLKLKNSVCESEGKMKVDFVAVPPIVFPIDSTYCENELYEAQLPDFQNVVWDKKTTTTPFQIRDAAVHQYEATYFGCVVKGKLQIPRKPCPLPEILFTPNIFSPNDDGVNDLFQAFGNDFSIKRMDIYDRWGTLVYSSTAADAAWNGSYKNQAANAGVYTYYVEYQDIKRDLLRMKKGDVMLLR
jgi:gliding motility-associated-like protein